MITRILKDSTRQNVGAETLDRLVACVPKLQQRRRLAAQEE